ncbi:ABC transporter permease [Lachnotalea sp. AF33-28]|uniref:ABC transporter permease n=1 Tax=Lachnotalea sp. AF33-28 TaxID=2292046 RepID=UPI000E4B94DB|nr:ABC transporter permease subunit [Lachnotalea sp. AF33-28]RHP34128.1 sugar ABC transporter permease [Lachnotalea sp. AF33-28]
MRLTWRRAQRYWQVYLFLLLPILYLILFCYWPMTGLQIAFKKFSLADGIWGSPFVGLRQFDRFFRSYEFSRVLKNTLVISGYGILASFPIPIVFALMLNSIRQGKFSKCVQTITYIPHFISTVVLVGMILQIFNSRVGLYGVIYNAVTGSIPSDLLANPSAFPHLYVLSGIWQNFGWDSIIYIAALTGISQELHEAAELDGASRFKRLLHIDLPGILPTITIMLILNTGRIMSVGFEKVYLMQNNLNLSASEVISTYVYKIGMGVGSAVPDYSYSTAIGLFNSVINLILICTVNAISRKLSETSLW